MQKPQWEINFDKRFPETIKGYHNQDIENMMIPEIKKFIKQLLEKECPSTDSDVNIARK